MDGGSVTPLLPTLSSETHSLTMSLSAEEIQALAAAVAMWRMQEVSVTPSLQNQLLTAAFASTLTVRPHTFNLNCQRPTQRQYHSTHFM